MTMQPAKRARKRRGPDDIAPLFARVDKGTKETLDAFADGAGVTLAEVIDKLVAHMELDSRGLPVWWPEVQQEVLDIPA